MLGGKTVIMAGVTMRADLQRKVERSADGGEGGEKVAASTAITIGRYGPRSQRYFSPHLLNNYRGTIISTNCTIRPPMRVSRGQMTFYPLKIGDNVFIGPGTHVACLSISSNVHIGPDCVLSNFCIIKEFCKILAGTVVPPGMMIPPGSIVAGKPARIVGEVGEGWGQGAGAEGDEYVEGSDLRPLVRTVK
jgi:dynactin-5